MGKLYPFVLKLIPAKLSSRLLFVLCLLMTGLFVTPAQAQDLSNLTNLKPIQFSGTLDAGTILYTADGIADRRQPFSYLLNGDAALTIYGVAIPFAVSYTETQNSYSQPFNQFGISPTYKWITLHLGYQNVEFSPYTLAGHTILGAGIELNPGKLRFGFMYGRLNKATALDTLTGALAPYSFSRKAYAAKLGYGTARNFFEFSYLQAKDDSSSVPKSEIPAADYIAPASNTVFGYESKFSFGKHIFFENTGAISIYTTDINSTVKIDSLLKSPFLQKFASLLQLNGTSSYSTAVNSNLGYLGKNFGLKIEYQRIDPNFQSMGAYFLNSDLESWTFDPNFSLFKNKVRMSGSVGFQHDNLLKQKESTTHRFISAGSASIDITKSLAFEANYSNFSNNQQPSSVRFPDSLRIVETTQSITLMPRYTIIGPNAIQSIGLSFAINQLNDYNQIITSNSTTSRTVDTKQYFLTYFINFPKRNFGLFANINRTALTSPTFNSTYQGVTVGGNANLLKNKLQLSLNSSVTQGTVAAGKSYIITATGTVGYKIFKHQIIKTGLYFNNNQPDPGTVQPEYSEYRVEIHYLFNF